MFSSRVMQLFLTLLILTLCVSGSFAQSKSEAGTYAITNARIVTVTGATIEKGTVLVQNGKIAAVGDKVSVPGNAKVIDGTGLSVYPGLIEAYNTLGLTEVGAVQMTVDTTELGDYNPNVKAVTAVNPHSELIPVARMNGVTTVLTCPQGGVISGQCTLLNIDGWTQYQMALKISAAMHLRYPTAGFGGFRGFGGFFGPPTEAARQQRDKKVEELKKKIEDAQDYLKAKEAAASDRSIPARPTDLALEAMIPMIKGELPVVIVASDDKDIKSAIELGEKYKLKIVLYGAEKALKVAPLLKEKNIPVIISGVLELPDGEDAPYDQQYARAAELHKAGVRFAISTGDDASDVRLLPYNAGMAAAFGLPKEEALKAITIYPAQMLGVDKMIGSIETGKVANLVVTDGDILEFKTRIKHIFINGHPVEMMNKHQRLYEKFKDRP